MNEILNVRTFVGMEGGERKLRQEGHTDGNDVYKKLHSIDIPREKRTGSSMRWETTLMELVTRKTYVTI